MILRRPRSSSDLSEFYCPTRRQGIEEVPEPELRVLVRDPIFYKDSGDCYIRVTVSRICNDCLCRVRRFTYAISTHADTLRPLELQVAETP
jgi:hypothetical protein